MAGQAFIFDLMADSSVFAEDKLKRILESNEIVKVRFIFLVSAIS